MIGGKIFRILGHGVMAFLCLTPVASDALVATRDRGGAGAVHGKAGPVAGLPRRTPTSALADKVLYTEPGIDVTLGSFGKPQTPICTLEVRGSDGYTFFLKYLQGTDDFIYIVHQPNVAVPAKTTKVAGVVTMGNSTFNQEVRLGPNADRKRKQIDVVLPMEALGELIQTGEARIQYGSDQVSTRTTGERKAFKVFGQCYSQLSGKALPMPAPVLPLGSGPDEPGQDTEASAVTPMGTFSSRCSPESGRARLLLGGLDVGAGVPCAGEEYPLRVAASRRFSDGSVLLAVMQTGTNWMNAGSLVLVGKRDARIVNFDYLSDLTIVSRDVVTTGAMGMMGPGPEKASWSCRVRIDWAGHVILSSSLIGKSGLSGNPCGGAGPVRDEPAYQWFASNGGGFVRSENKPHALLMVSCDALEGTEGYLSLAFDDTPEGKALAAQVWGTARKTAGIDFTTTVLSRGQARGIHPDLAGGGTFGGWLVETLLAKVPVDFGGGSVSAQDLASLAAASSITVEQARLGTLEFSARNSAKTIKALECAGGNASAAPPQMGTISGPLSYPSDFIPNDLKVCARNLETGQVNCGSQRRGNRYTLSLEPGRYHVWSQTQNEHFRGYKAYYTPGAACGWNKKCANHTPSVVTIKPGVTLDGIDPGDWFAP